jgi:hypothetical protein
MPLPGIAMAVFTARPPIVGNWADIAGAGGGANANVTPTGFTGTRSIRITHTIIYGSLEYRINSGSYVSISSGGSFSLTAGQTLNFNFLGPGFLAGAYTVTVQDVSRGNATIDTFTVQDTTV